MLRMKQKKSWEGIRNLQPKEQESISIHAKSRKKTSCEPNQAYIQLILKTHHYSYYNRHYSRGN